MKLDNLNSLLLDMDMGPAAEHTGRPPPEAAATAEGSYNLAAVSDFRSESEVRISWGGGAGGEGRVLQKKAVRVVKPVRS